jgi:3-hydroxyacyl-[acyl-carrier-protein] dehydratase
MPRALIDIDELDLTQDVMSDEEIRELVPHDFEFRMLDGVCHLDLEEGVIVGYKDWSEDAWWARGHLPGRPLMPGVLMIESCAQVSTILMKKVAGIGAEKFIGLAGLNDVRFRGQIVPPGRVHYVSVKSGEPSARIQRYPAQTFLNGKMVMQMELMGMVF